MPSPIQRMIASSRSSGSSSASSVLTGTVSWKEPSTRRSAAAPTLPSGRGAVSAVPGRRPTVALVKFVTWRTTIV
jgi:hypothetical protein